MEITACDIADMKILFIMEVWTFIHVAILKVMYKDQMISKFSFGSFINVD